MKKAINGISKKLLRLFGFVLALGAMVFNFTDEMCEVRALPEAVFLESGAEFMPASAAKPKRTKALTASGNMDERLGAQFEEYKLFGLIGLKKVYVYKSERTELLPCGNAVGISIRTDGVAVIGFGDVICADGRSLCPAKEAGLRSGDLIKSVNGIRVLTSGELKSALSADKERAVIVFERGGRESTISLSPAVDGTGRVMLGAWTRDSTVGIGTLSFVSKGEGRTAALGHAVIDADTGKLLPVFNGEMVRAAIVGVSKGSSGKPGELKGSFSQKNERIGSIEKNTEFGVFGRLDGVFSTEEGAFIPLAFPSEVTEGEAFIYAQVGLGPVEKYACRILRASKQNKPAQKGLVIKITDERLISATGGIVQGMSGSPIIKDGKFVGVVTHVFVNDALKGYGIYAYWMNEIMR